MEISEIATRWAKAFCKCIQGLERYQLQLSQYIQSAIDEATEELVGNVDILKGEVKHLEILCDEKDRRIAELEDLLK